MRLRRVFGPNHHVQPLRERLEPIIERTIKKYQDRLGTPKVRKRFSKELAESMSQTELVDLLCQTPAAGPYREDARLQMICGNQLESVVAHALVERRKLMAPNAWDAAKLTFAAIAYPIVELIHRSGILSGELPSAQNVDDGPLLSFAAKAADLISNALHQALDSAAGRIMLLASLVYIGTSGLIKLITNYIEERSTRRDQNAADAGIRDLIELGILKTQQAIAMFAGLLPKKDPVRLRVEEGAEEGFRVSVETQGTKTEVESDAEVDDEASGRSDGNQRRTAEQ